jgi:hypothetical protein
MTATKNVMMQGASSTTIEYLKERFGASTVQAIDYYLKRFDAGLDRIYDEPDKVTIALYRLFGRMAAIIEREIVHSVYRQFEYVPPSHSLTEAVGKLRAC